MKLKATIVVLILMAAVLAIAAMTKSSTKSSEADQPKLVMDSFEHSFGAVKAGTPLNFTFKVKNQGKAALEIKSVSPSCGCTTTNFDKVITAGKTGGITLAIEHTENYKGEIVKTAEVTTNDPDRSKFTLTLRANFTDK
ncbi:MAG: DUF1573 domain-containing protein [Blastocatellia bacterium]